VVKDNAYTNLMAGLNLLEPCRGRRVRVTALRAAGGSSRPRSAREVIVRRPLEIPHLSVQEAGVVGMNTATRVDGTCMTAAARSHSETPSITSCSCTTTAVVA
jgi:hypothetical protein